MGFIGSWSAAVHLGFLELGDNPFRWFSGVRHPDIQSVFETVRLLNSDDPILPQNTLVSKNYFANRLIVIAQGNSITDQYIAPTPLKCRIGFVADPLRKLTYTQHEVGPLTALCLIQNPYGIEWINQYNPRLSPDAQSISTSKCFDILLRPDFVASDTIWEKNDGLSRLLDARTKVSAQTFHRRLLWRTEYESMLLTALREFVCDSDIYKNYTLSQQYGIWPWRYHVPACRLAGQSPIIQIQQIPIHQEFRTASSNKNDIGFEVLSTICNDFMTISQLGENLHSFCRPISSDILLVNCETLASKLLKRLHYHYHEIIFFTSRHIDQNRVITEQKLYSPFSTHLALTRLNRTNLLGVQNEEKVSTVKKIYGWWKQLAHACQTVPSFIDHFQKLNPKLRSELFMWIKNIENAYERITLSIIENQKWQAEQKQICTKEIGQIGENTILTIHELGNIVKHLNAIAALHTNQTLKIEWHKHFWISKCLYAIVEYTNPGTMTLFQTQIKQSAQLNGRIAPNIVQEKDTFSVTIFISAENQPITMTDVRFAEQITKMIKTL